MCPGLSQHSRLDVFPQSSFEESSWHRSYSLLVLLGADIRHGKRKGMGSALHWLVPVAVAASRSLGADCVSS